MRVRLDWAAVMVLGLLAGWACASEPACYASEEMAAAQVGVRGVAGFRLESLRRDTFSGAWWAVVRSCQHPERPGVMILAPSLAGQASRAGRAGGQSASAAPLRVIVMQGGSRVRLVASDQSARLEVSAVALSSGAMGERIRVRLVPVNARPDPEEQESWPSTERYATGVVRSRDVVEMETAQ